MTQDNLHIAVYQFDIIWEDPSSNRAKIERWLKKTDQNTDLIVLPEMFTSGFTMNVNKVAESMEGETITWLKGLCAKYQLAICGSMIIRENNFFYNRFVFVEPSGRIEFYDKRHLFTMANEESHFQRGEKRTIINYKGWRICPMICYDLRFPVWSRNLNDYDLLIYSANWPQNRKEVWNTLLAARAIENQTFVVGANRVGVDGNGISYAGNSQITDSKGRLIASTEDYFENIVSTELDYHKLIKYRTAFPVLNDADLFSLK